MAVGVVLATALDLHCRDSVGVGVVGIGPLMIMCIDQ